MKKWEVLYDKGTMEIKIYYCEWDRENGPASHDLLRRAVEDFLGGYRGAFTVCADTAHGKPYVKELPDVHFSITHGGGIWACAVGGCEAGLDLQEVRERKTEPIAQRFFHPSEIAWLAEHDSPEEFFRIWAKKESYVKYTGTGLSEGLDYFSVVDGVPAFQQEIPFKEGYFLVLTTAREQAVVLEDLEPMGEML